MIDENKRIIEKLLEKSKECFVLAIEIYNKPTIRYRVEGFALFICNAWELMLKAHLIRRDGLGSIYFKDNPTRTISLEGCLRKIYTNEKTPLRRNLEKIIELRNTSTHFITEEYEMVYIPLFQACVLNFVEKMNEYHLIDMTEIIPQNFLTLVVSMKALDEETIKVKYPQQIAERIINTKNELTPLIQENNSRFAIKVEHFHYLTKNRDEATSFVKIDNKAETGVKIIKQIQDVNETHKFTMKIACKEINSRLLKAGFQPIMNSYVFGLFNKVYGLKENPKFCYVHRQFSQPQYTYSIHAIDLIFEEIKKDPNNIVNNLKNSVKRRLNK